MQRHVFPEAIIRIQLETVEIGLEIGKRRIRCAAVDIDLAGAAQGGVVRTHIELVRDELVRNADTAMYVAKAAGRACFRFYNEDMNARAVEQLKMEEELRDAMQNHELELRYQPQIDISSGQVVSMEALVRWKHPGRGMVSPQEFIPVAEETGLIVPIGEWVLETACRQAQSWRRAGLLPVSVGVNLSSHQFRRGGLVEMVGRILAETGWDARWLEFELTESVIMENAQETIRVLNQLKAMGITLSVDDFGTGYSNLSYLIDFSFGKLKIDRSFLGESEEASSWDIVKMIVALASGMGVGVVAEGVETENQRVFLSERGCHEIQGFLVSPAVPANSIEELIGKEGD